jgi:hypothetical protein
MTKQDSGHDLQATGDENIMREALKDSEQYKRSEIQQDLYDAEG